MRRVRFIDALHNSLRSSLAPLAELARLVPDGSSVLELGCGQGLILKLLASRCSRLIGVDFDPRKCEMAKDVLAAYPHVEILKEDIFLVLESAEAGSFDFLILSDTLSGFSLKDQDRLLSLAVSRLGPCGALLLAFVDDGAGLKRHFAFWLSKLIYKMRASRSTEQTFTYQSCAVLIDKLRKLGCAVDVHNLHRFPPRPIPHVALVARTKMPPPEAEVTFAVLNFRVGGQVSGVRALAKRLEERGSRVRWALPYGCASIAKPDVDLFSSRHAFFRFKSVWQLLRRLGPQSRWEALHLVVPSPAFSFLVNILRWPENRVVLHYEGPALHIDAATMSAAIRDPALIVARMIMNNAVWARFGKNLRATHLSSHPLIETQIQELGYIRSTMIENLVNIEPDADELPHVQLDRSEGKLWVAYVGHAHEVKGISVLIDAFERAADRRPELHLLIALTRDGKAEKARRRLARSRHAHRVKNVGLVNIGDLLRQVDSLLLPYVSALTTTLYPSLLLEAEAACCPIIVSDLPEFESVVIRDAGSVSIVAPGDRESLEHALLRLPSRSDKEWSPGLKYPSDEEIINRVQLLYTSLAA